MIHQMTFLKNCVHFLFFESHVHVKHLKVVMSWHLFLCARLQRGGFLALASLLCTQQQHMHQDQAAEETNKQIVAAV